MIVSILVQDELRVEIAQALSWKLVWLERRVAENVVWLASVAFEPANMLLNGGAIPVDALLFSMA